MYRHLRLHPNIIACSNSITESFLLQYHETGLSDHTAGARSEGLCVQTNNA